MTPKYVLEELKATAKMGRCIYNHEVIGDIIARLEKATALNMELTSVGGLIMRSQEMQYDERALGHCITFTDWLSPPYKILKRILDAKDGTARDGTGQ